MRRGLSIWNRSRILVVIWTLIASIDEEIVNRSSKTTPHFAKLRHRIWNKKRIKLDTKIQMNVAVVLTTLFNVYKPWTPYGSHINQLHALHKGCTKSICLYTLEENLSCWYVYQVQDCVYWGFCNSIATAMGLAIRSAWMKTKDPMSSRTANLTLKSRMLREARLHQQRFAIYFVEL